MTTMAMVAVFNQKMVVSWSVRTSVGQKNIPMSIQYFFAPVL